MDGVWQDEANLAKYPGLRDSLDMRSQYYRSKGQPEPQFLEPLETRRCIYGIVDLHRGIVGFEDAFFRSVKNKKSVMRARYAHF